MFKIKKPVMKKNHKFSLTEKDVLNKEVWLVLFGAGVPVTFDQDVIEPTAGVKEIIYKINAIMTDSQWDVMNRHFGSLGIDVIINIDAD